MFNESRKIFENRQTDAQKVKYVTYHYRSNIYLEDSEMELKMINYEKLVSKWLYIFRSIDVFFKQTIVLAKATVHMWKKLCQDWMFFFYWAFSDTTRVLKLLITNVLTKVFF